MNGWLPSAWGASSMSSWYTPLPTNVMALVVPQSFAKPRTYTVVWPKGGAVPGGGSERRTSSQCQVRPSPAMPWSNTKLKVS